ncbi:class I SAM-dependent methyltransferase, partial [Pseudomonas aeruginosa]|uniref:class I SAM-dependent methyltransferase n=1 Tax=Pseudomonas aeruginosa TaxID=287 RepID=UPI003B023D19
MCNRASGREVSVLDVGCGDGHTLDLYAARPDVQTHGVDFNLNALELAKQNGHSVYPGTFEDADLPSCRFNLVTA